MVGGVGAAVTAYAAMPDRNDGRIVNALDVPSNAPLAVFAVPRAQDDQLPPELAASVTALEGGTDVPAHYRNGALKLAESRVLLRDAGTAHWSLYAFPSARGFTCYALTHGPQSCHRDFTADRPIGSVIFDEDGLRRGGPTTIFGLLPNNVTGIRILVGNASYEPIIGRNAYLFELPDGATQPDQIVVTFRSRKTTTITYLR